MRDEALYADDALVNLHGLEKIMTHDSDDSGDEEGFMFTHVPVLEDDDESYLYA